MKQFNIPHFNEQRLVNRSLIVAAKHSSSAMGKFIHGTLAIFPAGAAYLLANQRASFATLKPAILVYFMAVGLELIQQYMAMIVAISTQVSEEAEKLPEGQKPVDLARFFILYIESQPVFVRWVAARAIRRFMGGDVVGTGKRLLFVAICQNVLGLMTVAILAVSFYLAFRFF